MRKLTRQDVEERLDNGGPFAGTDLSRMDHRARQGHLRAGRQPGSHRYVRLRDQLWNT